MTKFNFGPYEKNVSTTTGHSINTGPYGENREICSFLKLLH
jgi:hypothetical protein